MTLFWTHTSTHANILHIVHITIGHNHAANSGILSAHCYYRIKRMQIYEFLVNSSAIKKFRAIPNIFASNQKKKKRNAKKVYLPCIDVIGCVPLFAIDICIEFIPSVFGRLDCGGDCKFGLLLPNGMIPN